MPKLLTRPLFRYKVGCWVIEEVGPQHEGDVLDPNGERLQASLKTSLLDPLHMPIPLYSVNHEARGVAIKWLRKHKLAACTCPDSTTQSNFSFHRPFNPWTDTIFLRYADAYAFGGEPGDRFTVPEMVGRHASFPYSALPRLAVTCMGLNALRLEPLDTFMITGGVINVLYVVDVRPSSKLTLRELENAGAGGFPIVGLEETSRARVVWSSSRREWSASGDDEEARKRLRQMVAGLEEVGSLVSEFDWDVRLVYLTTP